MGDKSETKSEPIEEEQSDDSFIIDDVEYEQARKEVVEE